jgi:eukaryotic translation initiation factor 2C
MLSFPMQTGMVRVFRFFVLTAVNPVTCGGCLIVCARDCVDQRCTLFAAQCLPSIYTSRATLIRHLCNSAHYQHLPFIPLFQHYQSTFMQRGRGRGGPPGGGGGGGGGDRGRRGGDRGGSPYRGGDRGGSPYRGSDRGGSRGGSDRGGPPYRGGSPARGGRGGYGGDAPLIFKEGEPAPIDPNTSASQELITRIRGARPGPDRPSRPGYGTKGVEVALRANFFAFEFTKDKIFEYVVKIEPEPKSQKARVKRRVFSLFEQSAAVQPYANQFAHDGVQRLFAARELPQPLEGSVVFYEEGEKHPPTNADKYRVEVTFLRELPTAPLRQ